MRREIGNFGIVVVATLSPQVLEWLLMVGGVEQNPGPTARNTKQLVLYVGALSFVGTSFLMVAFYFAVGKPDYGWMQVRLTCLVLILLLIAGVEPNPGPEGEKKQSRNERQEEKRRFKERRAARKSPRQQFRRDKGIELVRAGVEENPGPRHGTQASRGPEPAKCPVAAVVKPKKVEAKPCSVKGTAAQELVKEMAREADRMAGDKDAHDDLQLQRKIAKTKEQVAGENGVGRVMEERAYAQMPHGLCFIPFVVGSKDPQAMGVGTTQDNMSVNLYALLGLHRVIDCHLMAIAPAYVNKCDDDGHRSREWRGAASNAMMNAPRDPGIPLVATYQCELREAGGRVLEDFRVDISVELFALAQARRIYQADIGATAAHVHAFLGRNSLVSHGDVDAASRGFRHTLVFSHLLLVDKAVMSNICELTPAAAVAVARSLVKRSPDPLAEGTYICGYQTTPADVFPKQWAECAALVRGGMLSASEGVDRFVSSVGALGAEVGGRAGLVARDAEKKAREYARILCSGVAGCPYIANLCAVFPDPFNPMNQVVGMLKRLAIAPPVDPADLREREAAIAAEVARQTAAVPNVATPEEALESAAEHCRVCKFAPADAEFFMAGCRDAIEACARGTSAVREFVRRNLGDFTKLAAFVKQESYPSPLVKAVRFIVCPCFYARGVMHALYDAVGHHYFSARPQHFIKALRPEEVHPHMAAELDPLGGAAYEHVGLDAPSFESLVDRRRILEVQVPSALAAAPDWAREMIRELESSVKAASIQEGMFSVFLAVMRFSGFKETSRGNAIINEGMTFAKISSALRVPTEEVGRWFRDWKLPYFFEGDDGHVALTRTQAQSVLTYLKESCSRVTAELSADWLDTTFCKLTAVRVPQGFVLTPHPWEVLGKLQTVLGCDPSSNHRDRELRLAKALSYKLRYAGLPLVDPVCAAIIRRDRSMVQQVVAAGLKGPHGSPAAAYLHDFLYRDRGELRSEEEAKKLALHLVSFEDSEPTEEVRAAIREAFGLAPSEQIRLEAELANHFSSGEGPLVVPAVEEWRRHLGQVRAHLHEVSVSARTYAAECVAQARTVEVAHRVKRVADVCAEPLVAVWRGLTLVWGIVAAVLWYVGWFSPPAAAVAWALMQAPLYLLLASVCSAAVVLVVDRPIRHLLRRDHWVVSGVLFALLVPVCVGVLVQDDAQGAKRRMRRAYAELRRWLGLSAPPEAYGDLDPRWSVGGVDLSRLRAVMDPDSWIFRLLRAAAGSPASPGQ